MAHFHGTSGAWRAVYQQIARQFPDARTPELLTGAIARLEYERPLWPRQAADAVKQTIGELGAQALAMPQQIAAANAAAWQALGPALSTVRQAIAQMLAARNLLRRLWYRCVRLPAARREESRLAGGIERASIPLRQRWAWCEMERARLTSQFSQEVAARVTLQEERLARLCAVRCSPEYAGAMAEMEAMGFLAQLPDSFSILSDVNLRSAEWIYFDRQHLRTAQLDHVVVGPPGVFVVEVKVWSHEFAQAGAYFDPFQQVKRSSYLCHRILREYLGKVKVRSIIATAGSLPAKPADSYAKVLRPAEVPGYVRWFGPALHQDECEEIVGILRRYVAE